MKAGAWEARQEDSTRPGLTPAPIKSRAARVSGEAAATKSPPVNPEHVVQHLIKQDQRNIELFFIEDFQPGFDIIS